jgi:hypothetical protein
VCRLEQAVRAPGLPKVGGLSPYGPTRASARVARLAIDDCAALRSTLHMSDPRPLLEKRTVKRKVIQIRVVLKPADPSQKTFVFNPEHPNSYLLSGWASLFDARTVCRWS